MARRNYISPLQRKLERLVEKGKIPEAIELLGVLVERNRCFGELRNEIILLKARYSLYKKEKRSGMLDTQDSYIIYAKIVEHILGVKDELYQEEILKSTRVSLIIRIFRAIKQKL